MRKVPSKGVFLLVFMACVAAQAARAQMIDDKMMPPVLVAPPVPAINDAQDDFQPENNDIIAPLSILQVPVLDIPDDDEIDGDVRPMLVGTFSLLHKVTAKVQQIQLLSGQEYAIGDMSLTMHDCLSTPPEEPPETKAFLQISEFKAGRDKPLFNGWMFASSPGINAMDHPVFDIWPLACKTEDGMVFTGEILPPVSDANVVATP
jgi:hypothetical protein